MHSCKGGNTDFSLATAIQIFLLKIQAVAEALLFFILASAFCHLFAASAPVLQTLLFLHFTEFLGKKKKL